MLPPDIFKYLDKYACLEARDLPTFFDSLKPFDLGLSLPLRGESLPKVERLLDNLAVLSGIESKRLLVIAVLNHHLESTPSVVSQNHLFLERLHNASCVKEKDFVLETRTPSLSVLWVDRTSSNPFTFKQGVGLARKIGCDLLCAAMAQGKLQSPWLWTTDADAILPSDYFRLPSSHASAIHYCFRHEAEQFLGKTALILYEIHLRHYFLGLHWAKSPFAYPTIGSCLAINPNAYVQVRGFQDRLAGEDFHLLNKLRKVGPVFYRRGGPVSLEGRFSERVPFGTGQSTIEIFEKLKRHELFTIYQWKNFECLKDFLKGAFQVLAEDSPTLVSDLFGNMETAYPGFFSAVSALKCEEILHSCFSLRKAFDQRIRHFHTVFDALKTLRFIHCLDEHLFPKKPWLSVLRESAYLQEPISEDPRLALNTLQEIDEALTQVVENSSDSFGNPHKSF